MRANFFMQASQVANLSYNLPAVNDNDTLCISGNLAARQVIGNTLGLSILVAVFLQVQYSRRVKVLPAYSLGQSVIRIQQILVRSQV